MLHELLCHSIYYEGLVPCTLENRNNYSKMPYISKYPIYKLPHFLIFTSFVKTISVHLETSLIDISYYQKYCLALWRISKGGTWKWWTFCQTSPSRATSSIICSWNSMEESADSSLKRHVGMQSWMSIASCYCLVLTIIMFHLANPLRALPVQEGTGKDKSL